MNFSNKTIKDIAENLDCGMVCYLNKETQEIKTVMDSDHFYMEEDYWKEIRDEIENDRDSYLKIEKMSSRNAFQVMVDFTNEVMDENIRNRLIYALNRDKPFKNFKYEVDYDEKVRQQWFKFKAQRYEEWVRAYLKDLINQGENESDYSLDN